MNRVIFQIDMAHTALRKLVCFMTIDKTRLIVATPIVSS